MTLSTNGLHRLAPTLRVVVGIDVVTEATKAAVYWDVPFTVATRGDDFLCIASGHPGLRRLREVEWEEVLEIQPK